LYEQMSAKILSLCQGGVHGLFVTLPDPVVVDAVRNCQELRPDLPIVSINAGYYESKELNLVHHVGMLGKEAGEKAAKKLRDTATTTIKKALCLNDERRLNSLSARCDGFGEAMDFAETGVEYLGQFVAPDDDSAIASCISVVENNVPEPGDWDGYGVLLASVRLVPCALALKKRHKGVAIGSFNTNDAIYSALKKGKLLFGIDQQPYLQGYLPVPLLTFAVTTKQSFLDHDIKTGPKFVISPPSAEDADCEDRDFPVCGMTGKPIVQFTLSNTSHTQYP